MNKLPDTKGQEEKHDIEELDDSEGDLDEQMQDSAGIEKKMRSLERMSRTQVHDFGLAETSLTPPR